MAVRRVRVGAEVGLHARPAALFVQTAARAGGEVTVAKGESTPVSAKSVLALMGLDVRHGDEIVITAHGEDSEAVLDALVEIANAQ
ncbi:HPr family phosphocarrier protein [Halostreptopolyspora alba]|uniref:Phosphocarrier protein HPr n=1 Tax=Halostreptopolyspora alba TaxID=2487137 RepID=A0A3N0E1D1_9ACTN|nr:HPr family phosphocarrier protein [Nocardiopsaceae bacterium YIM 96095]